MHACRQANNNISVPECFIYIFTVTTKSNFCDISLFNVYFLVFTILYLVGIIINKNYLLDSLMYVLACNQEHDRTIFLCQTLACNDSQKFLMCYNNVLLLPPPRLISSPAELELKDFRIKIPNLICRREFCNKEKN